MGALLYCNGQGAQPDRAGGAPDTSAGIRVHAAERIMAAGPAVDTSFVVDTVKRGDTTIVTQTRRIRTILVQLPAVVKGMAFGLAGMPADTACARYLKTNTTVLPLTAASSTELGRLRQCGGRTVLRLPRDFMKVYTDSTRTKQCLNADSAVARARRLNWPMLRPYIDDGTVLSFELQDDVARAQEWCLPVAAVIAAVNKAACAVIDSAPLAPTGIRALATQTALAPHPCVRNVRAQYAGPTRHGDPAVFNATQLQAAAAQNLKVIFGLNLEYYSDGGITAADLTRHVVAQLKDPRVCGHVSFHYAYTDDYLGQASIQAAFRSLADSAAKYPATRCVQR